METATKKVIDFDKVFKMKADRLLVRVQKGEQKSAAGLILPTNSEDDEQASIGEVLAVSQRVQDNEYDADKVEVGDTITFSKHAGTTTIYKGETFRIMRMTDIMFVLNETV